VRLVPEQLDFAARGELTSFGFDDAFSDQIVDRAASYPVEELPLVLNRELVGEKDSLPLRIEKLGQRVSS
jgi:hypothetical protein